MAKISAAFLLVLAVTASAPTHGDPHVCVGAMTDIDILFRVRQSDYFERKPLDGRKLRLEYDGCGYRVHVGESARDARDGDLLLVDRHGRVTRVVRRR